MCRQVGNRSRLNLAAIVVIGRGVELIGQALGELPARQVFRFGNPSPRPASAATRCGSITIPS
jgi:hypothetical protein